MQGWSHGFKFHVATSEHATHMKYLKEHMYIICLPACLFKNNLYKSSSGCFKIVDDLRALQTLHNLLDPRISWSAGCLDSSPGTTRTKERMSQWCLDDEKNFVKLYLSYLLTNFYCLSISPCKIKSIWKVLIWGSCRQVTSTPNNQLVSLTCWQLTSYEFAKELCMKLPACHECPSKPRCPPQLQNLKDHLCT